MLVKGAKKGNAMNYYGIATKILRGKAFFWTCLYLVTFGLIIFIYFSFKVDVDRQDELLYEIRSAQQISEENNKKLDELEKSNNELKMTNQKLVRTICILQEQIESLGAKPLVDNQNNCVNELVEGN